MAEADLDLLVVECADRIPVEGLDALETMCAKYPTVADELRAAVGALLEAGVLQAPLVVPGAEIGGYHILREIGQGGMGVVFEAADPRLRRTVAIKVLRGPTDGDLQSVLDTPTGTPSPTMARFVAEAQIGGQLDHPGVVPVHDIGVVDGCLFFAMKVVRGDALGVLLSPPSRPRHHRTSKERSRRPPHAPHAPEVHRS